MAVRIPINLATQPFRRDRPVLAAFVALSAALTVLLAWQIGLIDQERREAAETRVTVDRLSGELRDLRGRQARVDAVLNQSGNALVLERSVFLNSLIERKAISWTRIFADLEKVMPANVRLVSVRLPQVDVHNQVLLDMVVGAEQPAPVLEFLKKLAVSPQFGPASLITSTPPSQTNKLWTYRVSVSYAQKL